MSDHVVRPGTGQVRRRPLAYLLSMRTYATWLPGDQRGSFARTDELGTVRLPASTGLVELARRGSRQPPFRFRGPEFALVDRVMREVCAHRGWGILAVNIRREHCHLVAPAAEDPDRMARDLKAWVTRRLREARRVAPDRRVWSEGASTRFLFTSRAVAQAVHYVDCRQGGDLYERHRACVHEQVPGRWHRLADASPHVPR